MVMKNILVGAAVVSAMSGWCGVSDLQVEYRNGQVFLRWQEKDLPADARLSVWSGAEPIRRKRSSGVLKTPTAKWRAPANTCIAW